MVIHLHESLKVSLSVLRSLRYDVESQSQNRLTRSGSYSGPRSIPRSIASSSPSEFGRKERTGTFESLTEGIRNEAALPNSMSGPCWYRRDGHQRVDFFGSSLAPTKNGRRAKTPCRNCGATAIDRRSWTKGNRTRERRNYESAIATSGAKSPLLSAR
jgi:hypothetical protein